MIELLWIQLTFRGRKMVICALYHPPKPLLYKEAKLIDELERVTEIILTKTNDTLVILAGDFNQLSDNVLTQLGFVSVFQGASHQGHSLDRIYATEALQYQSRAITSFISTSHKAVIACVGNYVLVNHNKVTCKKEFRMRTPCQHAALLSYLDTVSWNYVLQEGDTQAACDKIYQVMLAILDYFYPTRSITVTNRDPYFVTPAIKALLRKRNRLMRKGAVTAADSLTQRIGQRIAKQNRIVFAQHRRGSKQMWDIVRRVTGKDTPIEYRGPTAEKLNQHFADLSRDPAYETPLSKATANQSLNECDVRATRRH